MEDTASDDQHLALCFVWKSAEEDKQNASWGPASSLRVCFLYGEEADHRAAQAIAQAWNDPRIQWPTYLCPNGSHSCGYVQRDGSGCRGDIRIGCYRSRQRPSIDEKRSPKLTYSYSYLGANANLARPFSECSMTLYDVDLPKRRWHVLHCFGLALGLYPLFAPHHAAAGLNETILYRDMAPCMPRSTAELHIVSIFKVHAQSRNKEEKEKEKEKLAALPSRVIVASAFGSNVESKLDLDSVMTCRFPWRWFICEPNADYVSKSTPSRISLSDHVGSMLSTTLLESSCPTDVSPKALSPSDGSIGAARRDSHGTKRAAAEHISANTESTKSAKVGGCDA